MAVDELVVGSTAARNADPGSVIVGALVRVFLTVRIEPTSKRSGSRRRIGDELVGLVAERVDRDVGRAVAADERVAGVVTNSRRFERGLHGVDGLRIKRWRGQISPGVIGAEGVVRAWAVERAACPVDA